MEVVKMLVSLVTIKACWYLQSLCKGLQILLFNAKPRQTFIVFHVIKVKPDHTKSVEKSSWQANIPVRELKIPLPK